MISKASKGTPEDFVPSRPKERQYDPSYSARLIPTQVYDTYWRFAAERQAIYFARVEGRSWPWTRDPILSRHRFTNAYRAADRVSQYLISEVIYGNQRSCKPEEIVFRTLLFKLFNKITTWELLEQEVGEISWQRFDFDTFNKVLGTAIGSGVRIYSAAYIMPSASAGMPGNATGNRKHHSHLRLIEYMMGDGFSAKLAQSKTLEQVFRLLLGYPSIGSFLAYQFTIDLNYSELIDFSENDFVVPGPGASNGIRKCFSLPKDVSEADSIRFVQEVQQSEFQQRGINFPDLWGRPLQLIDCQNLFCETDKYARVAHPEVRGITDRARIKQIYRPTPATPSSTPWFPPKWGLNQKIAAWAAAHGSHSSVTGRPKVTLEGVFPDE